MKSLSQLNKYFLKYKWLLLSGIVFVVLSNLLAIYPAQMVREALDLITSTISGVQKSTSETEKQALLAHFSKSVLNFGLIVIGLALGKGVFMFFMRQTIIVMSRRIEYELKNDIYKHYQILSLGFYRQSNTGDLIARISEDVSRVRMYIGPAIMYTINLVVMFILVITAMFRVNAHLSMLVLIPMPILGISIYFISTIINKKSERVQSKLSDLSTFVQERISGIRVIKAFVREDFSNKEFKELSEEYKDRNMSLIQVNAFFAPLMITLVGLSTIITIYFGGKEVIAGNLTAGNIAEFIIYVNMLTWPVTATGWVSSLVQRAAASQTRINEFLLQQPDIKNITHPIQKEIKGEIVIKDLNFTYKHTGIQALKNFNLSLKPGESVAVLGRTGSGKSTLANLLCRMYDPQSGSIELDGFPLDQWDLKYIRKAIGYVPQDVFLFSESIYNNIAFGLDHDEQEIEAKVHEAAKDAVVYDNIMGFSQRFDTIIGERGITLSGGQKQRVSIARALIKDPQILIFDDCLSAVDTETEERILSNLSRKMQGRTTLIISHRVSSAKLAQKIIFLEDGEIVEFGTSEDLLAQKGKYFEMVQKQLNEQENLSLLD